MRNVPTSFEPQDTITKEQNETKAVPHQSKLTTFEHNWYGAKESNSSNVDNPSFNGYVIVLDLDILEINV